MALFAAAGLLVALSWAAATAELFGDISNCNNVSLANSCESYLNSSTTTVSPPSSCCDSVTSLILCFCSIDDNSREDIEMLAPDCGIGSYSANCSSSSSSSSSSSTSTSISPTSSSASSSAPSPSTESTPAPLESTPPPPPPWAESTPPAPSPSTESIPAPLESTPPPPPPWTESTPPAPPPSTESIPAPLESTPPPPPPWIESTPPAPPPSTESISASPTSSSLSSSAPSPSTESTSDSGSQHTPSITAQAKSFPIGVIAAVVAVVCVLAIAVAIFCLLKRRTRMKNTASDSESGADANSLLKKMKLCFEVSGGSRKINLLTTESLQYDLNILKEATEDFSVINKIGRGAFGTVYKGVLANGEEIAVKRLTTDSERNTEEFKNEVSLVARLQHRNLVRLMGFCFAGEEKLLVFEFVPNKSLDHFLFEDQEKRKQLDWKRRYKIIEGIARGLLYLHQDSRHKIVHRDLKAANILLDANMIPKISDFGTARLVHIDNSCMETLQIAGTRVYMAPEYLRYGQYSEKSDVYSFGVLILEIISGSRRVRSSDQKGMPQDLLNDAWNCWSDGEALNFMDETLASSYCSSIEVMKCIQLGLLCVQQNPEKRPTMVSVLNTLHNITTIILPEPQQPTCFNTLVPESSSNSSAKWTTPHSSEVANP